MPSPAAMNKKIDQAIKEDEEAKAAAIPPMPGEEGALQPGADQQQAVSPEIDQTIAPVPEAVLNQKMLTPEQIQRLGDAKEGMDLVAWVMRQHSNLRSARKPYERKWYTNLSFYAGKQYVSWDKVQDRLVTATQLDPNVPRITINKIRPIVRTEIAKLTSAKPTASVMPASNDDDDVFAARAGEQVWDSLYNRLKFQKILRRAVFWLSITGNAFIKTYWDENAYDPTTKVYGDIRWAALSPFNVLVPDQLEEDIQDQAFVLIIYNRPIEWINAMYGDVLPKGVQISANTGGDDEAISPKLAGVLSGDSNQQETALIIEAWVKPGATKLLPDGGFLTIVNNKIIQASVTGLPYEHGRFPLAKMDHVPTGKFYSESVIDDLIPLQVEYNRTASQIIESKNKTTKPQVLYDENSVTVSRVTTEPGQWIPVRPNASRPSPLPVQELPAYVVQLNERMEVNFEDISGQHQVSKGSAPPGVSAATAIANLQEGDDTYVSPTIASLEEAVQETAVQSLSLAADYWTVKRLVKTTGDDGGYEAVLLQGSDIANGLDLRIDSGSALPDSKAARIANVMDFMDRQYIEPQEGFELLDMPMLQQWTTRRAADKRAAQQENIEFKKLSPEAIQADATRYELSVQAAMQQVSQVDPATGQPLAPEADPFGQPVAPPAPPVDPATGQPVPPVELDQMGMPMPKPSIIPINEWDNDEVHIAIHELQQKGTSYKMWPEPIKKEMATHIAAHKARLLGKMQGLIPDVNAAPTAQGDPGSGGQPMAGPPMMDDTMLQGAGPSDAGPIPGTPIG